MEIRRRVLDKEKVNYQSARSDIFRRGWLDSGPSGPHGTPGR